MASCNYTIHPNSPHLERTTVSDTLDLTKLKENIYKVAPLETLVAKGAGCVAANRLPFCFALFATHRHLIWNICTAPILARLTNPNWISDKFAAEVTLKCHGSTIEL